MAKKSTAPADLSKALLERLASMEFDYIPKTDYAEHLAQSAYIEVGAPSKDNPELFAARITDAGRSYLNSLNVNGEIVENTVTEAPKLKFEIITNAAIPDARPRGLVHRETIYPFADLPVQGSFFVADNGLKSADAMKTMSSAVASANMKYRTATGQTESKERAKRDGRKAVKDEHGTNVMETVTVPVYHQEKKFVVRHVEAGKAYGGWTAPSSGALISRIL